MLLWRGEVFHGESGDDRQRSGVEPVTVIENKHSRFAPSPIGRIDDRAQQRGHQLNAARKRARPTPAARQAHTAQALLSAGQTGEGDADGAGTGGAAVGGMGASAKGTPNISMQWPALRAAADTERWARSLETTAPRLQCDGKSHSEALPLKKAGELLGI